MEIREATISDVEAMLAIYAPYVEQTAITFEYDVPTTDDFRQRLLRVLAKYPWIVAQEHERIVGYAYASAFKERAAYHLFAKNGSENQPLTHCSWSGSIIFLKNLTMSSQ